ncbi:sulfatase-like hydrolase/transferase [uncultured Draconibacterium sp.]|uniref:sulfatase-like hydrolase/transferase n=1 Tax=uncultured Draconibacterium sp. TaxID=1573823 RepID=UPI0029C71D8F|nr:sulfatase-like hydrolase/transferase [uncultured Draconibacterium sp.]
MRRFFILIILIAFSLTGFAQTRPNIIFIMTDDQSSIIPGAEDNKSTKADGGGVQSHPFGFNGDNGVHTPIIDGLAKNGIIFTRAYVSSSVCSPSRYATLTGRYAGRCEGKSFLKQFPSGKMTRVENNTELEENRENLPRLLQRAGYKTGFVGKSHVVDHHLLNNPENREQAGLKSYEKGADPKNPKVNKAMQHNHKFWAERIKEFGFDYANGVYAANLKELNNDSLNIHNVEWKNKAALDFIDKSGDEPFFLYYSETVPHGPAPWLKKNGKYTYGLDSNIKFTSAGYAEEGFENMPDREEIKAEIEAIGKDPDHAWLRWFDHAVGSVVEKLKEKGKLENTLIVITSDHGNYNYAKSTIYEGGVKIPLMMYWPAGIKAGSVYNDLVQNIDYTPTFLDLAGVDLKSVKELDGVSLKETLKGNPKTVHDYLFFELGFARGVMTKDWKYITVRYDEKSEEMIEAGHVWTGWNKHKFKQPYYIRNSHLGYHAALLNEHYFERNQLYNLNTDPKEDKNIAEVNPKKVKKMKKLLVKKLKSFPDRPYGEFVK